MFHQANMNSELVACAGRRIFLFIGIPVESKSNFLGLNSLLVMLSLKATCN